MLSQTPESFVDVLVIGAGPAGLMCSNALAAANDIKVKVIDQRYVHLINLWIGMILRLIQVFESYSWSG